MGDLFMTTQHTTPWVTAFAQLTAQMATSPRVERPNPRPAGVVRRGSPAHVIFEHLAECPSRFFTLEEIRRITGTSHATASTSVMRLVGWGLVEAVPDARNSRYRRYRVATKAEIQVSDQVDARYAKAPPFLEQRRLKPVPEVWSQDLPAAGPPPKRRALDLQPTCHHGETA